MRRKARTKFQRFKKASSSVSSLTAFASLLAFISKNPKLANKLLNVSAVSGISSVIPSRKTIKKIFSRGNKLTKAKKSQLIANAFRFGENASILVTKRVFPVLGFAVGSIGFGARARRLRRKQRSSRARRVSRL